MENYFFIISLISLVGIHQCVREGKTHGLPLSSSSDEILNEGCRIHGYLEVNKVSGNFHIAPGQSFEQHHIHVHSLRNLRLMTLNTSHRIDQLTFGERFPQQINPLSNTEEISKDSSILYHYYVKVVPTMYVFLDGKELMTNQYSATKHRKSIRNIFDSSDHQLPGVFVTYEISAIMVKFLEQKRSLAHFFTSLCAMIVSEQKLKIIAIFSSDFCVILGRYFYSLEFNRCLCVSWNASYAEEI